MSILSDLEIRCITNDFKNYNLHASNDVQITETCIIDSTSEFIHKCIINCDYSSILQKSLVDYGLPSITIDLKHSKFFFDNIYFESDNDVSCQVKTFNLLFIGISALQEFVRCNFCGPTNDDCDEEYGLISDLLPNNIATDCDVIQHLSLDGEAIYSNVKHPKLLYVSQLLLSNIQNSVSLTQKWWLLRCMFLHQCILTERNESIHSKLVSVIHDISQMDWINKKCHVLKKLIFSVESCHVFLFYGEIVLARKFITDAQIITGLEIELSGAIGKRTQYQQNPVAQLYVKLKRNHLNFTGTVPERNEFLPSDLLLQDDTLLNRVAFIDNDDQVFENLYAEEQIVLLGYCCLVKRSGSCDELLQEELMSYINCLLSQPQIWSIYLKALIMRCKSEKTNSRKIERAMMQMETIVKSVKNPLPPFSERQNFFYSTSFPTYWMLEKELADLLLTVGCTKNALEIYERLELWEDIVECYIRLGRTNNAEKLIKEQIANGESAMLWCLLGDVTQNPEHYMKAWELSNNRSARAQRSLGYYYYRKNEFEKCITPFLSSLEINHLQPQVWFSVGYAATQAENFDLAARAYRQVVIFDEDQFEAWNNLANAYIKTNQKVRAWRSLNEALKCNYEEWRVWENFLLVSTDVGAFEDALRAWHRIFDIKGKHNDSLLLDILVNAIIKDLPDINGMPSSRLRKRTLELFGRITSCITNEPKVWELYAALIHSNSEDVEKVNLQKVVLYQQKAIHCYNQRGSWERDYTSCKEVLISSLKLVGFSLNFVKLLEDTEQNQQKTSVKLNVQSVMTRAKKFLVDFSESERNELINLVGSLKNNLNEILSL